MKLKQRKQKQSHIRAQQKAARDSRRPRKKTLTYEDIIDHIKMVEGFAQQDRESVEEYDCKLSRLKKKGIVLLILCSIFNLAIFSSLNLVSENWNTLLFFLSISIAIMPWIEFKAYQDSRSFWKSQLQEHLEYLDTLKHRLIHFDSNRMKFAQ